MKPEQNNQQSNWLAETEEVVNAEAAQINGGSMSEALRDMGSAISVIGSGHKVVEEHNSSLSPVEKLANAVNSITSSLGA